MLGRMYGNDHGVEKVRQVTTNDRFAVFDAGTVAPHWPLPTAIDYIIRMAERKDRMIVAWSIHEFQIVERYCPQHLERFKAQFVNAKLVAERWKGIKREPKPTPNKLPAWLSMVGYDVPDAAKAGLTGETIGDLGDAIARGATFETLTPKLRQRWLDVLDHNRHDCNGMREIFLLAAAEIAQLR